MMKVEVKRISASNYDLVKDFLSEAKEALPSFRYFKHRDFSVLDNHKATFVSVEGNQKVAYGHLDEEDGAVWLGIAVADKFRGKGFGRLMMETLISEAKRLEISEVRLAVDLDNMKAMKLYEQFGFEVVESDDRKSIMKWVNE